MDTNQALYLPSDLYSRNYIIARGISALKSQLWLEKIKILDIGGVNGQIINFLDSGDELTLLDIRKGTETNLIIGDATHMNMLKDKSVDIVISSDVFEHIPEPDRLEFISEALRVAKYMVVIAAPFDSAEVSISEKYVRDFFKDIMGYEHQWLVEHYVNGLPDKNVLERKIIEKGLNFTRVGSNNINNWLLIQLFDILKFSFICSEKDAKEVNKFYNENIGLIENDNDQFYRYIYFITKEKGEFQFNYSPNPAIQKLYTITILSLLNKYFIDVKDKYIALIETFKNEQASVNTLVQQNVKIESTIRELENARRLQGEHEAVLRKNILELEHARHLQSEREASLRQNILDLENAYQLHGEREALLRKNIVELEQAIVSIQSTRAWKIVNFFGYPYSRLQHYVKSIRQEIDDKGLTHGITFSFYLFANKILKLNRLWQKMISSNMRKRSTLKSQVATPSDKSIGSTRIVFISGCPGDTMRYRVYHQQEQLHHHGIMADTYRDYEIDTKSAADKYDIFILHRVPITPEYETLIARGKKLGKIFIFDTDDLVFDEKYGKYIRALNEMSKDQVDLYYEGLRRFKSTMSLCDFAICSTEYLKRELEANGKTVYMNVNSVSDDLITLSSEALNNRSDQSKKQVVIGYLSGTKTHNIDFKEAEEAIIKILSEFGQVQLVIGGYLDLSEKFDRYADRIVRLPFMDWRELPKHIANFDINICPLEDNPFCHAKSDLKYFEAALLKVPTIASNIGGYTIHIRNRENGMLVTTNEDWYDALKLLINDEQLRRKIGNNAYTDVMTNRTTSAVGSNLVKTIEEIINKNNKRRKVSLVQESRPLYPDDKWPSFSIISILYNKEKEVKYFLESFLSQRYKGDFEIIFVDDCSTDNSVQAVADFVEKFRNDHASAKIPDVNIIRNNENVGNCTSRNTGIAKAKGDILVVIDADCIVNKDFLKYHAQSYLFNDYDVSIGPINLETNGRNPFEVLLKYENNLDKVEEDALPQDRINRRSFINCITRNFSVRRKFVTEELKEDLFDPDFSYSKKGNSGFGWEDVEMGYRLYQKGARINYVPEAFSIHVSHPPSIEDKYKPIMSVRNFNKLYQKHPELVYASRRWTLDTYQKISQWLDSYKYQNNEDKIILDKKFQRFLPAQDYIPNRSGKKLKILAYRWHCAHQYEIFKLPYEFTLVTGLGTNITGYWEYNRRPLPENVRFERFDNIDVNDYDLAIVHFDEMMLTPENSKGVISPEMRWGDAFKWFMNNDNVKIPKIGICHGTPQFYGQYDIAYKQNNLMTPIEGERQKLLDIFGDTLVITNSYQAQKEWNFKKSKVIWHGFDPSEFPQATYEKGILVMGEREMKNRPHYNGYLFYNEIMKDFLGKYHPEHLSVPEPDKGYGNNNNYYARSKFDNYVRELGKYSIYLNPTLRSPMPRTRGEAMISGLAIVTAKNHDVELFIKNGVNGFYSDKPQELREYLLYLCENPSMAREIGEAGRQCAMDVFNHDRFLTDWEKTIKYVLQGSN